MGVNAEDAPASCEGSRGVRACPPVGSGVMLRANCARAASAMSFARYVGLNASSVVVILVLELNCVSRSKAEQRRRQLRHFLRAVCNVGGYGGSSF